MPETVYSKRSSMQIMQDVVSALFVREVKTRFGSSRLGYFWAIAEPVSQIVVFTVMFSISGRNTIGGIEIPIFIMTGIFPFMIFGKLVASLSQGIEANRALFVYRQIEPIDPILTRLLIEIAVYIVTFIILMLGFSWVGYTVFPDNILQVLAVNGVLIILGFGIGLTLCSAALYTKELAKIIGMILRPLYFLSGVFFSTALIPVKYWGYLSWNPVLHLVELHRMAFSTSYYTSFPNWSFPILLAIFFLLLGLMLYKVNYQRFVASS